MTNGLIWAHTDKQLDGELHPEGPADESPDLLGLPHVPGGRVNAGASRRRLIKPYLSGQADLRDRRPPQGDAMSAMGSHDVRNEGRRQRWLCDECGAEYGSYTAAERCEIADRKGADDD